VNIADESGNTSLHWALILGDYLEIVQCLCDADANRAAQNFRMLTPFDYAKRWNRTSAINFLNPASAAQA
jgi:ankyrin repeat protein